jgi:hypothetical protein
MWLIMKRYGGLDAILILCGLSVCYDAASHPYDTALEFRQHKTDDGRIIFSNIPKKCFSQGRLTCDQLHPVFKGSGTVPAPEHDHQGDS